MAETYFIRCAKTRNYSVMDNTFFRDEKLSWKAKGLFGYLLTLPEDWKIYVSDLKNRSVDGETATRAAINELIENGYIIREQTKDSKGKWSNCVYKIIENPYAENPHAEKPNADNPPLLSTKDTKYLKKEKDIIASEKKSDNSQNDSGQKNNDYESVFEYYMTLKLTKHRVFTNDMLKAIKKAMTDNSYDIEYCKVLLKRHETVVEKTKDSKFPVKARGLAEFFGQKVHDGVALICSEYDEGGKYYNQYIKPKNTGRTGVPPCESVLGKREEGWM